MIEFILKLQLDLALSPILTHYRGLLTSKFPFNFVDFLLSLYIIFGGMYMMKQLIQFLIHLLFVSPDSLFIVRIDLIVLLVKVWPFTLVRIENVLILLVICIEW